MIPKNIYWTDSFFSYTSPDISIVMGKETPFLILSVSDILIKDTAAY